MITIEFSVFKNDVWRIPVTVKVKKVRVMEHIHEIMRRYVILNVERTEDADTLFMGVREKTAAELNIRLLQ